MPSLISGNWPGVGMSVLIFGLTLLFMGKFKGWSYVKQQWTENILIGLAAVGVGWLCLFVVSMIHAVYTDHRNIANRWQAVVREKDDLKKELKDRDDYIKHLEGRTCPECIVAKVARVAPAPTIGALTLQARAVCALRNPSLMPKGQDTLPTIAWLSNDRTTYLDGPHGKFYFQSNPNVPYRRAEDEGQAYSTQTFTLPPESNLLGQPTSWMHDFTALHVELWSISGNNFTGCSHAEFAMLMNGVQIYSTISNDHFTVPSNYLVADIKIKQGEIKF